jgi:hypothetical protein
MTGKENRYDRWSHDGAPSGDDARRIQEGINAAMRETIKNPPNPNRLNTPQTVRVANAPVVTSVPEGRGFIEPKPLESPSAKGSQVNDVIAGLADKFLGPATPGKPDENK